MSSEHPATGAHDRRRQLAKLSQHLLSSSRSIALESDKWFVLVLRNAERGARRLGTEIGCHLVAPPARLLARFVPARSPRDRIRRLLRAEAKRANFDVSQPQFEVFSERMAVLLDLVFSGAIDMEDVAFEADDSEGSGAPPTEVVAGLTEDWRRSAQ